jgi:hypothetical protein
MGYGGADGFHTEGPGGGGGGTYNGASPSTVNVNGIPAGTNISGMTYDALFQNIYAPAVAPVFTSFSITGQATTVEVGTLIAAGNKTFTWGINIGSGVVPTIDIYDNTTSSTLLAGTPNDGTQVVSIPGVNFTADGQTQSYKGIGNNTTPPSTFNSSNFVITANYLEFYGPTPAAATNSAQVRALPSSRFTSAGTSFSMNTGTVEKIFQICMPATKTLVSVFDATAGFFITGSFVLTTFNVNDAGGNPVAYNIYTLTNAVPYAADHVFNIVTT